MTTPVFLDEEAFADTDPAIAEILQGAGLSSGEGSPSPSFGAAPEAAGTTYLTPEEPVSPEEERELRRSAMAALYGPEFPLLLDEPSNEDWGNWPENLWTRHAAGKRKRLHLMQRNRLFRDDVQWVSADRQGSWKQPPKSPNVTRYVHNMIAPALDMRVQIVSEQRPGFKTRPLTQDQDDIKQAEAQQVALEYAWDQQKMPMVVRESEYWAGTDGSCFWHIYWDADAGPWHEETQLDPTTQQEVPTGVKYPVGDLRTEILRCEQVVVSANASATRKPMYWVLRREIPLADAVARYGTAAVKAGVQKSGNPDQDPFGIGIARRGSYELPGIDELFQEQETVEHYVVYCEPSEFLPKGLRVEAIGCYALSVEDLPWGVVPCVRFTDGSTDPAFFPQPIVEHWVNDQILVNALISRWIDSIRINGGGRFIGRPGTVSTETLVGGLMTMVEVRGTGPLTDSIQQVQGFSIGNDVKELLAIAKKSFEDKSGWNDASRGSYADAASGRAILAQRESLERIFAEPVNAAATAAIEWGKINIHGMRWGYELPRTVGVTGKSRADLAVQLHSDDFDAVADVEIDPETLMPMPRALRLFLLDQMFERGVITAQEYRRRLPFAYTRNIETPDEDHLARAKRVAEAIRAGKPAPPVIWQDNEAIHQDVLEREILLRDDLDPDVVAVANERWQMLAQQALMKSGGLPPGAAPPTEPGGNAQDLPPTQQPFLATNPGVATAPVADLTGFTGERQQALMDRTKPY
jgi:hypothetical protein